ARALHAPLHLLLHILPPPSPPLLPSPTLFRSGLIPPAPASPSTRMREPARAQRNSAFRPAQAARPRGPASASPGENALFRWARRSEEHTSELQSLTNLVCRLLLEKKNKHTATH